MQEIFNSYRFQLLTVNYSELGGDWKRRPYSDPFDRLYLITDGKAYVEDNQRRYELLPGHLCLIPSHLVFAHGCYRSVSIWFIHFTAIRDDGTDLFQALNKPLLCTPSRFKEIKDSYRLLKQIFPSHTLHDCFMEHSCLFQMLAPCSTHAEENWEIVKDAGKERFQPALRYLEEHLSEPCLVERMAQVMKVDVSSFSRSFKKTFGVTPIKYVRKRRIARAATLLHTSERKLSDIAAELGFCDEFHFSKVFKEVKGRPPSVYRYSNPHLEP